MAEIRLDEFTLLTNDVKKLLDEPVQKYLIDTTIAAMQKRAYNIVSSQIIITSENTDIVIDCINAIAAWHSFGSYGQSISNVLQLQDLDAYRANLEHYKEIAIGCANLIGIDLEAKAKPVGSDTIPILKVGRSELDVDFVVNI